MICPKCGHELKEGNMYCEICGEEIQIVPDFEPEIENSISDALSDVADQIDPNRKNETKEKTEHIHFLTDTVDISNDVVILPKGLLIKTLGIVVAIIAVAIIAIGMLLYRENSYSYQLRRGDEELAKGMYSDAIDFYQDAYRLDKTNMEALKRIASVYENYENLDKAEEMYLRIIEASGDMTSVEALINLYVNDKKYTDAFDILEQYGDDNLLSKYEKYISPDPVFSVEEGEYEDITELELLAKSTGNIYYTLDGSEPGSDSTLYEKPIILRNGKYHINAIFVNEYDICSSIVSKEYSIISNVPEPPIVNLASGSYDVPQLIRITVPLNSNVYYTTDGSDPGLNSAIYTEPISIPLGDSVYKFIAVNSDGVSSDIAEVKYSLSVDTNISQEQAIDLVRNRQFEIGRVITADGDVAGSEGKYMYAYSELRYVQNRTLYLISEYYQEGTIRMVTGNVFAVDVFDGHIYQAVAASNNTYSLVEF